MPFILVIVGILMIITGAQGTYSQFASQVGKDFTGPGNFTYWILAIGIVGAVGYVQALQSISRLFMFLIILVMFLSNKGFFTKFTAALKAGPTTPQPGLSLGATAPTILQGGQTPQQGVQNGSGGVGVNWNPFTNGTLSKWFSGW